jgi:hypothetical protein
MTPAMTDLAAVRGPVTKDALWRKVHGRMFRYRGADAAAYNAIQAAMRLAQAEQNGVRAIRPVPCLLTPEGEQVAMEMSANAN